MIREMPESDWKCMKKVSKELLNTLCSRINQKSIEILMSENETDHDKYLKLYQHIKLSDEIVAQCFNDWRRSTLMIKLLALQNQGLINSELKCQLSESTRNSLEALKDL